MLAFAALLLAAYLIGGIPFGYLLARARGVDILAHGSGNIGATNVGRLLGFRFGLLVFVLDFFKGVVPVAAAMFIHQRHLVLREDWLQHGLLEVSAGLMAFLGHVLPIYLGFRGGKGVATAAGVVALLVPVPALCAFATWVVLTSATRYISLASVGAAFVLCIIELAMTSFDINDPRNWFCILAAALVLVRHRTNLTRLWHGTENRLPPSAKLAWLARALHMLAVALWFGAALFFTFIVAPHVFTSLESVAQLPAEQRPWLLRSSEFDQVDSTIVGPREQTSRIAGRIVEAIFPRYFLLQIICASIALIPALVWWRSSPGDITHRLRCGLLLTGVLLALAGVWLEHMVHDAREPRNAAAMTYLRAAEMRNSRFDTDAKLKKEIHTPLPSTDTSLKELQAARSRFGMWHGISLLVNYAAILTAAGAMILTVSLPVTANLNEVSTGDAAEIRVSSF